MKYPLIGPSSPLRVPKAEIRRSINMIPASVDSGTGKATYYGEAVPGLVEEYDLGGELRGTLMAQDRAFVVAGTTLYELFADGTSVPRGNVHSTTGPVGMDKNRNQIAVSTGPNVYSLDLATNTLTALSGSAFYGSANISVLSGRGILARPNTDTFYLTAIDDFLTMDALEFASAESSPDKITGQIVDHGQLFLMGQEGGEVWDSPTNPGPDFPFIRSSGARIQVGCVAPFSLKQMDNSIFWLGQDKVGAGIVWKLSGYTPVRVSNFALEQLLQALPDLSGATAYTLQEDGRSFYALNVDGLSTTWVYDSSTTLWHERAEWIDGDYAPHRATCHLYAFGKHLVGAADGKIYRLDPTVNTNAGDTLMRRVIGPHLAAKDGALYELKSLGIECDVGQGRPDGTAPLAMMRYSKNGGKTWSNWHYPNLGVAGDGRARPKIHRPGSGRDWVVDVACTEDTRFNILGGIAA